MAIENAEYEIQANELVLDVGGGHNPFYRANVVVDLLPDDDTQRGGALQVGHCFFVEASGENLPFTDKGFDYIWSNHTVEHSENPVKFCKELSRVGERGYLGSPSEIYEVLWQAHEYHNWILNLRYGELIAVKKSDAIMKAAYYSGKLFQVLQKKSPDFNRFYRRHFNIFKVNINWEDEIECVIQEEFPILDYNDSAFVEELISGYTDYVPVEHKPSTTKLETSRIISLMRCDSCLQPNLVRRSNEIICPDCGPVYQIQREKIFLKIIS